jgi:hypothetical protein
VARTRDLDAKIRVREGSMGIRLPLRGAFFLIDRCRNEGVPVSFEATGPDAARAIEIIEQTCTDPPRIDKSTLGEFFPRIVFGQREEGA